MSQRSLEDICLSFCRDTALEILALRQQGGGFLPCLTTKILRIYSSINWYINIIYSIAYCPIHCQDSGAAVHGSGNRIDTDSESSIDQTGRRKFGRRMSMGIERAYQPVMQRTSSISSLFVSVTAIVSLYPAARIFSRLKRISG